MNLADVDLNLLKVFEALYIDRNVSRAADRLGVAQSSLSSSLKRLRSLFSDELFVRSSQGMIPTKRAMAIEPNISDCLDAVREAMAEPESFDPASSKRLFTIGGSDFSAFTILPMLIRFLKINAPHIRLAMKPILPSEFVEFIDNGKVDLVVGAKKSLPKRIFQKALFTEDMAVITRKDNPYIGADEKLNLKKYAQLQHIYITSKGEGEKIIDRILKKRQLRRDIYLSVQNFLIVPYIVENSDLAATVSKRIAYQCSQRSKLNIHPFPVKIDRNKFSILWGKTGNSDTECQWMIQTIADLLKSSEKPQA